MGYGTNAISTNVYQLFEFLPATGTGMERHNTSAFLAAGAGKLWFFSDHPSGVIPENRVIRIPG